MKGFILTRHWRDGPDGVHLSFWLATDNGPLLLHIPPQPTVCFVRQSDLPLVQPLLEQGLPQYIGITLKPLALKNCHGEPVAAAYCRNHKQRRELAEGLQQAAIACWEADIKPVERFLMERFITASLVCENPDSLHTSKVKPVDYRPPLQMLSLDIETSMDASQLYSIAAYSDQHQRVFMVDADDIRGAETVTIEGMVIHWCPTAKACLQQFLHWLAEIDPDVIIGWHVVQFDLWVLQQLCDRWQVPFTLGRQGQIPHWREDSQSPERHYAQVAGRVVLDGIELLRTAFYRFDSFSLQAVAGELLGETKLLEDDNRAAAITQLFATDKLALANYNLKDCELVWRIFAKTRLLDFAIARSQLTGLALDRAGGSVASFEYAYLPRLHRAGYVAPNLGEIASDVVSPGGYVLRSKPGIYRNVLVLDFKSLYPSIIRTFLIDPCGFWVAQHQQLPANAVVAGFNDARFARDQSILPGIIAELWQARDAAKADHNLPLSQAIKIMMNSFYGVLGSPGCRFFDPRVCSSITLRGHEIIQRSRDWLRDQGYDVIYGDTDSLFVWLGDELATATATAVGEQLALGLNQWWRQQLLEQFAVNSALEIEFETHYQHFLMPTIRGSMEGSKKRYAGIIVSGDSEQLVFKGLESVRTDWTVLAKQFQRQLYHKIFKNQPYQQLICDTVQQLLAGALDQDIVYQKKLRRPLVGYQKSNPPHVKAGRRLQQLTGKPLRRGDRIDYVITVNGPEPVAYRQSAVDYHHYIDKQLKPIANSILGFVGDDFDEVINQQLVLL